MSSDRAYLCLTTAKIKKHLFAFCLIPLLSSKKVPLNVDLRAWGILKMLNRMVTTWTLWIAWEYLEQQRIPRRHCPSISFTTFNSLLKKFSHTSVFIFVQVVQGIKNSNISPWHNREPCPLSRCDLLSKSCTCKYVTYMVRLISQKNKIASCLNICALTLKYSL
jgi:hypothetical protein